MLFNSMFEGMPKLHILVHKRGNPRREHRKPNMPMAAKALVDRATGGREMLATIAVCRRSFKEPSSAIRLAI